jgi:GDP-mannose 6-dehydrogenase
MTRIGVYGLGYVGAVSVGALAQAGHEVIGVDPNLTKVEMINQGRSPVVETGLDDLIRDGVRASRITATTSAEEAVRESDVSIVCVGTPSNGNGSLDLTQVEKVCQEIGLAFAELSASHVVMLRSTVLPGSTREIVIPTLEQASGKRVGDGFGVCFNPEFLREGSSIRDFLHPPFTLIGGDDQYAIGAARELCAMLDAPVIETPIEVAEMVKYACNAFHALKVTFANEIGAICAEQGIDSHRVMDVLCQDDKLNISTAYLKPGFAFGGSCLPKDLRALVYQARRFDVEAPLLEAIMPSNAVQVERALQIVRGTGSRRVGVLGFSFKAGTDDLRESPIVELIERLLGKGYDVRVYDRSVSLASLHGANRAYIEREIPHIASLMVDSLEQVVASSDVVIVGNGDEEFRRVFEEARPGQTILDLVRIGDPEHSTAATYRGICW